MLAAPVAAAGAPHLLNRALDLVTQPVSIELKALINSRHNPPESGASKDTPRTFTSLARRARSTVPGSADSKSSAERNIGVCSPLLLTHTTAPSRARIRSTSAGKRKALMRTTAAAHESRSGSTARLPVFDALSHWRQSQHGKRKVDGEHRRKALRQQTRIGADAATNLHRNAGSRVPTSESTFERVQDDCRALGRRPRVPFARHRVEERPHFAAQFWRPPAGIESGGSTRRDAHRVIAPS
jgi:hypothetical protein